MKNGGRLNRQDMWRQFSPQSSQMAARFPEIRSDYRRQTLRRWLASTVLVSPGVARSSELCWEFTAKKTRLNSRGRSCLSMQSAEASADHNHVRNSHQNVLKCVVLFNQRSKSQSYSASCYIKLRNTVNLHPWGAGTRYQIVCFAIKRLIVWVLLGLQARAQDRPT